MQADTRVPDSQEIELKLTLPTSDAGGLAARLARAPLLARRKPTHLHLHNVYHDTPEQLLRQQRIALRIRRAGSGNRAQWLQTLKIAGSGLSALSRRGEWESPVAGAALDRALLAATPWADFDPHDTVFEALAPVFVTTFERTIWLVRRRDGSMVEVALDVGQFIAGDKVAPICELELELLAGEPRALFDVAQQIAGVIAVLPLAMSKAERGYALAQDALERPLRAQPAALASSLGLAEATQQVLREMFCQLTGNLHTLGSSNDPEVVHQARVGWRRFRSAWRLFAPSFTGEAPPSWEPLQPLMALIGELRDLDVALTETLPALSAAFVSGDERRARDWQALQLALVNANDLQRRAVRQALEDPAVGTSLLGTTRWLEDLTADKQVDQARPNTDLPLRRWARRRVDRLEGKLRLAMQQGDSAEAQHRVRILAKRLRYAIEALRSLLPKKRTRRRDEHATELQTRIGAARDFVQAGAIAARLGADRGLLEFLRGVATGRTP